MITTTLEGSRVQEIRPVKDARWDELVNRHPRSSVFHTSEWLEALRRTYGYQSYVLTTTPSGRALDDGMVFCRIDSWLTGHRLVSLPFSDHCDLLTEDGNAPVAFLQACEGLVDRDKLSYVEVRPYRLLDWDSAVSGTRFAHEDYTYCFHELDLSRDLDSVFRGFHKDSTQRKIRRAEREKLVYAEGRSDAFINAFYGLMLLTRRRHGLPPQPRQWFRNLADCFGDALKIRIALKDDRPLAAIVTLQHKEAMVYKYGCSDPDYNNLGGTHMVMWKAISDAKCQGLGTFDFGRSDFPNEGLMTFKDRWGSTRSTLVYARLTLGRGGKATFTPPGGDLKENLGRYAFSKMPLKLLSLVGDYFYRHIG